MRIGAAQLRPRWLDKAGTVRKVIEAIGQAAAQDVQLLAFPEAFLSGYPFWLCRTNAAAFDEPLQKQAYAQFLDAAVEVPSAEIAQIVETCRDHKVSIFLGANERGSQIGRGSIYCAMIAIDAESGVRGVHRKLVPTFDERLCWSPGDGNGMKAHAFDGVRVGALNCWENWMPFPRFAMYASGEDVHIAAWPGNAAVAGVAPQFIAREGRVYVVSVMGLLSLADIPDDFALKPELAAQDETDFFTGGTVIVAPTGELIAEAASGEETIVTAEIDLAAVRGERQNFDVSGHYNRPDVFDFSVSRRRPGPVDQADDEN
ncbi:carbon-nitrogen hydrolase family protein [Methyloligella solikamskensis]|uniref:Carbon-nitrogen hydrolase family protein n=1 Tax=Methyloligella solikamskensis TaxID=1177756 RepID=A0ABW3J7P3_9HYPH